ncbi:MAG: chromosome segregation protein SMC, partial [Pseudomonadota bacterium]
RQESEKERLTAAEADVQKATHLLEEAESAAEKLQKQVAEAEAEHRALTANEARARQALDRLTSEHTQAIGQKTAFDQEGSQQQDIQDRQDRLATLKHALEGAQQAVETTAAAKQEAMQKVEAAHPPRDEAMAKVNAIQAEIDTLTRILRESEVPGRAILEDITVAEGYEAALAAALEDGLSASEDGEADRYWSPLGSARMKGSFTLPEGAQPLSQYVTAPEVLTRRLQMIGVITADQGQPLSQQLSPGQRLVTPEGDLWRWDGFVAKAGAKTAAAQRLAQKRELAARTEELEHAFENRDAAERLLGEAKVAVARLSEQEQSARTTADNARKAAETVERELNHLKAEEQKRDSRGEALTQRVIDLTGRLETAQQEMADAHQKLQQLGSVDNLQTALHDARRLRDEARAANGRARGIRAELRRDAEGREARLRQIKQDREGWARRQGTATERVETILKAREETHTALEAAEKIPSQLEERRESLYEAVEAAEGRRRVAADALAQVQTALNNAERLAKTADEAASLAREVKARTEAMGEAAKERLDDVKARAQEVNEGPAEDLLTLSEHDIEKDLPDQDILEEKIEKLKREREALGGVNLCADQEMQEIDTRLEEITTERQDCEAAIAKLRGAISGLNRDGRQRLLEAFDKVNTNFQDLFKQLFGGGEARLELVDSDDPLEAGLEIFASPPGKKLTSMSLMSGGEQALTATALIFAVFRSNPAPVCVLDEVDAPLDDANTDRFCSMLSKMAEETHTRFIAITHHPLTMSRMDRLYGVTMIERGVSQLVSVDLKDAEQMAA